ncbi:MAG: DUF6531 domain-containing protein [Bdellovibrionaceae bacterium]|nr:DUF6531 domain-containing protein [Pseudobdellovibrionaceae bacterium]
MKTPLFCFLFQVAFHFALALPASAGVDLKDAGYSNEWTDIETGPPGALALSRVYRSRTQYNGLFGFGWCTRFEILLERLDDRRLLLRDCESGDLVYALSPTGEYLHPRRPGEKIIISREQHIRFLTSGDRQVFASSGRLRTWIRTGRWPIETSYSSLGRLEELRAGPTKLRLVYDEKTQKITRVISSNGSIAWYEYSGPDLIRARSSKGHVHAYRYDQLHNLSRIQSADGLSEELTYDTEHDRVMRWKDSEGCVTEYTYSSLSAQGEVGQTTESQFRCKGAPTQRRKFEYWWRRDADGSLALIRTRDVSFKSVTETSLDPRHGLPAQVTTGAGQTYHLFYDARGRLISIFESGREQLRLIYERETRRPAQILRPGFGRILLRYDAQGRMQVHSSLRDATLLSEVAITLQSLLTPNRMAGS